MEPVRPVLVEPLKRYPAARKAEFLLSTASTAKDYQRARKAVKKLRFDPDAIGHHRPE